jgi:hypothetical protein
MYIDDKDNERADNSRLTGRDPAERGYFFARFADFFLGFTWGSGGLFSIARSRPDVRLFASRGERKSSLAISAACSAAVNCFTLLMAGV